MGGAVSLRGTVNRRLHGTQALCRNLIATGSLATRPQRDCLCAPPTTTGQTGSWSIPARRERPSYASAPRAVGGGGSAYACAACRHPFDYALEVDPARIHAGGDGPASPSRAGRRTMRLGGTESDCTDRAVPGQGVGSGAPRPVAGIHAPAPGSRGETRYHAQATLALDRQGDLPQGPLAPRGGRPPVQARPDPGHGRWIRGQKEVPVSGHRLCLAGSGFHRAGTGDGWRDCVVGSFS